MGCKDREHLQRVKRKLAEKYERLARVCSSVPKRKKLMNRAEHYRRQVDQIARVSAGDPPA